LDFQGGPTLVDKEQILLRQAVAALLNVAVGSVYPLSASDIITMVNNAIASGDPTTITNLADTLDSDNNRCDVVNGG
jgi:hypothetical protein